jgi:hypothetical protein
VISLRGGESWQKEIEMKTGGECPMEKITQFDLILFAYIDQKKKKTDEPLVSEQFLEESIHGPS